MAVSVRIDINNRFLNTLLRSPFGPVARNMVRRGDKVKRAAIRNINSRTGTLARSITVEIVTVRGVSGAQVGTTLHYARYVHDGTGIYGPTRRPIRPRRAKALTLSGAGQEFSAYSSGQRGTHFLARALSAAG